MEHDATPEELHALIARLESRERDLEARIGRLESQLRAAPADLSTSPPALTPVAAAPADESDAHATSTDRRQLFKKAGVMAAGTLAAGSVLAVAQANPAAAATVTGSGNPGVRGTSVGGNGVEGETSSVGDSAVYGLGTGAESHGVYAKATNGNALIAESTKTAAGGGDGINTIGNRYGIVATGGRSQIIMRGDFNVPPTTRTDQHLEGEIYLDQNGDMWACVIAGIPGKWRKINGPDTAGALHVLPSTTRIYDSRPGTVPPSGNKGKFTDHQQKTIDASAAVVQGATAVMINATATNTNPGGFFAFFIGAWPNNSSLSWGTANTTVAVTTVVALTSARTFVARCEGAGGADLIVDVIGYYR